jgi:hypothetical protein
MSKITEHIFICECGNNYKHRQSLYTHKKKCKVSQKLNNSIVIEPQQHTNDMVMLLLNQNIELQNQNIELQKKIIDLCKQKALEN